MKTRIFTIFYLIFISLSFQGICFGSELESSPVSPPSLSEIDTLDLKTACRIALSDNPSIKAAMARIRQARQKVLQARALYWPKLDASASADRIRLSDNAYDEELSSAQENDPLAEIRDPENYYTAGITATWVMFDGFERRLKNLSAKYGKEASEYACEDLKRILIFSICESYYSIQLKREEIKIVESDRDFNLRLLNVAKARRNAGVGSLSHELSFRVRLNRAEVEVIKAKHQYEASRYGLAALLGLPEAVLPAHIKLEKLTDETYDEMAPSKPGPHIQYAMKKRPDVLQKEYQLKKAASEIEIARGHFYPDIILTASLSGEHEHNARFENDDFGRSVGVMFTYNLFSGGSSLAELREKKAAMMEIKQSLGYLNLGIKADIRSTVTEINSAQKQVIFQRSNEMLFRRNRDLSEKEYTSGQGSLVRLNEAQRDLVSARGSLIQAVVNLGLAQQKLYMMTGENLRLFDMK